MIKKYIDTKHLDRKTTVTKMTLSICQISRHPQLVPTVKNESRELKTRLNGSFDGD